MTTVTKQRVLAGFAISQGRPLVDRQPLAVSQLQSAANAGIAARRILATATAPFGKDAATPCTRVLSNPVEVGAPLLTAAAVSVCSYLRVAPNPADFPLKVMSGTDVNWLNPLTDQSLGNAQLGAGGVAFFAGAAAAVLVGGAIGLLKRRSRGNASQQTLDATHLQPLAKLHDAVQRPLERTLVGQAAQDAIATLTQREVHMSRAATKLLDDVAASATSSDEHARHGKLITSINALEDAKEPEATHVDAVIAAFDALTSTERSEVAAEMLGRLFIGSASRNRHVPFAAGRKLHTVLSDVAERCDT